MSHEFCEGTGLLRQTSNTPSAGSSSRPVSVLFEGLGEDSADDAKSRSVLRRGALEESLRWASESTRLAMAATRRLQLEAASTAAAAADASASHPVHFQDFDRGADRAESVYSGRCSETSTAPRGASRSSKWLLEVSAREQKKPSLFGNASCPGIGSFFDSQGGLFQVAVVVAIALNMLVVVLETDFPDWPSWPLVDGVFLLLFTVEFVIRAMQVGLNQLLCTGTTSAWMLYDFAVLLVGAVDFFFCILYVRRPPGLGLAAEPGGGGAGGAAAPPRLGADEAAAGVARVLMLTRLLRMFRLLRMHSRLLDFTMLLLRMLSMFAWILSMVFMLCFVLSIFLVRLIGGDGLLAIDDAAAEEKVRALFADIPTSLFTLFQLTTVDNWATIADPMIELSVFWRLFFVAFITFVSWTMLSLLTAVASETMMSREKSKKSEAAIELEVRRQGFITFLCGHFIKADADGNGVLDKDEFISLMTQPSVLKAMAAHGVELKVRDLSSTWDAFDIDDSGELTIDELIDGFCFLMQDLATKHVSSVEHSLKRFTLRLEMASDAALQHLSAVEARQTALMQKLDSIKDSKLGYQVPLDGDFQSQASSGLIRSWSRTSRPSRRALS